MTKVKLVRRLFLYFLLTGLLSELTAQNAILEIIVSVETTIMRNSGRQSEVLIFEITNPVTGKHTIDSIRSKSKVFTMKYKSESKWVYVNCFFSASDLVFSNMLFNTTERDSVFAEARPIEGNYHFFDVQFKGEGSVRLNLQQNLEKVSSEVTYLAKKGTDFIDDNFQYLSPNYYDQIALKKQNLLKRAIKNLDDEAFSIISLDTRSLHSRLRLNSFARTLRGLKEKGIKINFDKIQKIYTQYLSKDPAFKVAEQIKNYSKEYFNYLKDKPFADYYILSEDLVHNYRNDYEFYKSKTKGQLRDRLMQFFFTSKRNVMRKYIDSLLTDYLPYVQSAEIKDELVKHLNLSPGKPLKDFQLRDLKNQSVSLSSFKGKIILLDFWWTGCGACASYYQSVLSYIEEKYHGDTSVVFITISVDEDFSTWEKSVKQGIYTNDNAINLFTNGKGFEHPIIKYYNVFSAPQPVLIDMNGNIFDASINLRKKDFLIDAIQKLKKM